MMTLHYADYIVFGLLLVLSMLVGPFYMWRDRHRRTTSESYFLGNRSLHIVPTAASLFASFFSAISLVGIPAELYTAGAKFTMVSIGEAIGVIIGAVFIVPVMYKLELISAFGYLEGRFHSKVLRKIGTVTSLLQQIMILSVTTFAPCIALEAVSPIPLWASVAAIAGITMIYTVLGGIKAVVLVDFIQAIVMFAGVLAAIIIGYWKIDGGISRVIEIAQEGGRLQFFDFDPDPTNTYNFWVTFLTRIIVGAGIFSTSQMALQRYSALPTTKQAIMSVMAMAPQLLLLNAFLFFLSIAMFAHYDSQGCDPLRGGIIKNPNQLTTFYIADILHYPGLIGLWFAALFSGSLSSMSTGYNSVAACIWEDLLKEPLQHRLSPRQVGIVLKLITFILGVVTCGLAIAFSRVTGSVIQLSVSTIAVFGSGLFIAFFSGLFFPFTNAKGSVAGMIVGTTVCLAISVNQLSFGLSNRRGPLPTKIGNCSAMIANLIASGRFKPQQKVVAQNVTAAVTASLLLLTSSPANLLQQTPLHYSNETLIIEDQNFLNQTTTGQEESWRNLPEPLIYLFSLSFYLFPIITLLIGLAVAVVVSFCTGGIRAAAKVHPKYLVVKNCFFKKDGTTNGTKKKEGVEEETIAFVNKAAGNDDAPYFVANSVYASPEMEEPPSLEMKPLQGHPKAQQKSTF